MKCAGHFSEMISAFQWNAQFMKCSVHFSEMHSEMRNYMKCAALFTEMHHISLKSAVHFSNIRWAFGFPPSNGCSALQLHLAARLFFLHHAREMFVPKCFWSIFARLLFKGYTYSLGSHLVLLLGEVKFHHFNFLNTLLWIHKTLTM